MNDGTYAGDNFGSTKSGYKEHAEKGDPGMNVVRFTRAAEDKKDIIMVNWQAHPCITGAASNQNAKSYITGETPTTDYQQYGMMLGDYVLKVLDNMTPVEAGAIRTNRKVYTGKFARGTGDGLAETFVSMITETLN